MQSLHARIDAAQGKIEADVLLKGASVLDVVSLAWRTTDVAIFDGHVVGVLPGYRARREVDLKGKWLVPGFIDAHVHVESSLLVPAMFERAVLPRGTTTAICDPHELANVLGVPGIRYFLTAAESLALSLRVNLSSCVPATAFETNGGGEIRAGDLVPLRGHRAALGLAEMMNIPGVLGGDPEVLAKLGAFADAPIDGHCPLVSGPALAACRVAGLSSCHESTQAAEGREKLQNGFSVWIREGSVAKDLHTLAPLLNAATSIAMGFCADDRNPLDIAEEGHLDHLIRGAIRLGVPTEVAYRAASWSVANHYGLRDRGQIAPGALADLVVLGDADTCAVDAVWKRGCAVSEIESAAGPAVLGLHSVRAKVPEARDLEGPAGRVHAIEVTPGKILTGRRVVESQAPGVARLTVLERYGHGSRPANGYAIGFGEHFDGAIASSVGHDSHNLIVAGKTAADMRVALAALIEAGGGYAVVRHGKVLGLLPLPFGGLMSRETPEAVRQSLRALRAAGRAIGCTLPEPFLQLAFLSLPVIPSLKLTDKGLFDVDRFALIDVAA